MICPNCQSEFPDGVKFCSSCGTPLTAPVEKVEEAIAEVNEELSVPEVQEVPTEDMPSASFDPGAPIAMPKQADEAVSSEISSVIPEASVPEVAPVEEVLPEYPQTAPAFAPAPAPAFTPAPAPAVSEPVIAPIPAPSPIPPSSIPGRTAATADR